MRCSEPASGATAPGTAQSCAIGNFKHACYRKGGRRLWDRGDNLHADVHTEYKVSVSRSLYTLEEIDTSPPDGESPRERGRIFDRLDVGSITSRSPFFEAIRDSSRAHATIRQPRRIPVLFAAACALGGDGADARDRCPVIGRQAVVQLSRSSPAPERISSDRQTRDGAACLRQLELREWGGPQLGDLGQESVGRLGESVELVVAVHEPRTGSRSIRCHPGRVPFFLSQVTEQTPHVPPRTRLTTVSAV